MPFWWRRRRRPWFGPRFRSYRRKYKTRRRRFRYRSQYRRPTRRRRRRRRKRKVRRKLRKITIKQWQPERIVKCKIKGVGVLVAGADGSQHRCYTETKDEYTQQKAPGGGGIGLEVFTLEYLYKQWLARKNIWTKTNDYTDLVRFTGASFRFFRHPDTDFVIKYSRQPPFQLDKDTFPDCHPQNMLLKKHKRVLRSVKYSPTGKSSVKLKIRPPNQMITKWFFQKDFADQQLLQIQASAMNLGWGIYGPNTQSTNITIAALNIQFYKNHNWSNSSHAYKPYDTFPTTQDVEFINREGGKVTINIGTDWNYQRSVNKKTGFFQSGVLQAVTVKTKNGGQTFNRPVTLGRYNPDNDTGQGNRIYVVSTFNTKAWQTPSDADLIIGELPLYMGLLGAVDYLKKKKAHQYLVDSMIVIRSPYISILTASEETLWPIVDWSFIQGKTPWDETLTTQMESQWYPTLAKQMQVINDIVECGPYMPKYTNLTNSSWCLPYTYTFYFKWGGSQITEQLIQDPSHQEKYPVPDTVKQAIQIADPQHQNYKNILRAWDFRRGIVTKSALKRMYENLSATASDQSDFSESPQKKKKVTAKIPCYNSEEEEIKSCLHSLCEKSTFQETETQDIKQLLYKQYQQQEQLKHNLYKLLSNLSKKQRTLQIQTGLD
nr:MAG: ORF1 [Torque teno midi virus]